MRVLVASFLIALFPLALSHAKESFACNANALTSEERARYLELTQALRTSAQEQRELRNGYAFRLPPTDLVAIAEWVSLERKCCPFFTFEIEQARDQGPVWLRITGTAGVKEFIRVEFEL